MKYFYGMKQEFNWGPSLPYYLAAEYSIHPTYIQKMLATHQISDVFYAIMYLRNKQANSFNVELMKEALGEQDMLHPGTGQFNKIEELKYCFFWNRKSYN